MAKDDTIKRRGGKVSLIRNSKQIMAATAYKPTTDINRNFTRILRDKDLNIKIPRFPTLETKSLPIPRGNTSYALAKRAEYEEKNLYKAETLYKQAILEGERVESALKDLASVLHQQGKTQDACELLKKHSESLSSDPTKFQNLPINLEKQVIPSGNCLNKCLRISGLSQNTTESHVRKLFKNSTRILDIVIHLGIEYESIVRYAILKFPSHSAARKTLESFHHWDRYSIEWVSVNGEIVGDANFLRQPKQGERTKLLAPLFCCALFARDPENLSFTLPVDKSFHIKDERHEAETPEYLIGKSLSKMLSFDIESSPEQQLAD